MAKDNEKTETAKSGEVPAGARKDELAALTKKLEEYENDLKRLAAEFDNYRKRVEKEKAQARLDAQAQLLHSLLIMRDEFDSALSHIDGGDYENMKLGLNLLSKKLSYTLSNLHITEIPCNGKPNPHLHEVVGQIEGGKEGEIAQVIRKGYVMGDTLLRPAQVCVYSNEKKKNENEAKKEDGNIKNENENKK